MIMNFITLSGITLSGTEQVLHLTNMWDSASTCVLH